MDKETKKLNAEELEKRAAPVMPITDAPDSGDPGGGGSGGSGGSDPVDTVEPPVIEDEPGGGKKPPRFDKTK